MAAQSASGAWNRRLRRWGAYQAHDVDLEATRCQDSKLVCSGPSELEVGLWLLPYVLQSRLSQCICRMHCKFCNTASLSLGEM
jgi:lipid A disaccharide synthetase